MDELIHTGYGDDEDGAGGEDGEGGGMMASAADEDDGAGVIPGGAPDVAAPTAAADEPEPEAEATGFGALAAPTHDDDGLEVRPYGRASLRLMSDTELSAIDGFEVSHPGRGTLRWPGRTDVRSVVDSLSSIIKFRPQGVSVYEDGGKPAPGEGLNKQCVYVMENVWVRDRSTGDFLTDVKSISAFKAQLLRKADKMGARMVEYDHNKGEWTIEVAHF